ncbi:MAG: hypothetical protein WAO24_08340 [Peptococcia bacterium]
MRRRRQVFWDALLSLGLSWFIADYINKVDPEARQYLLIGLTAICLLIILPKALHRMPPGRPWSAGFSLPIMLSPLLIVLSYPGLPITPFAPLWQSCIDLIFPWSINYLLNFLLFFLIGFSTAAGASKENKSITWPQVFFSAFTLVVLYAAIIYLGFIIL